MYKQIETTKEIEIEDLTVNPAATLCDENGNICQIARENNGYVLYVMSEGVYYPSTHIFSEAWEAMCSLRNPKNIYRDAPLKGAAYATNLQIKSLRVRLDEVYSFLGLELPKGTGFPEDRQKGQTELEKWNNYNEEFFWQELFRVDRVLDFLKGKQHLPKWFVPLEFKEDKVKEYEDKITKLIAELQGFYPEGTIIIPNQSKLTIMIESKQLKSLVEEGLV